MKSYVCITGAAGGLGKAFALECAARGWDLYLTDINESKLALLADGLSRQQGVHVLTQACDFLEPDAMGKFWTQVRRLGIHFHMLINVAGLDFEGRFQDLSLDQLRTILRVNMESTVLMTRRVLEFRNPARHLHIINVASLAGFYPMPYKAVYAASKRFLLDFTRAIRQELAPEEVSVLALCPAGLATKVDTIASIDSQGWIGRLTTLQTGVVAARTLNRSLRGVSVFIPGWPNQILRLAAAFVPPDTMARLIQRRWSITRSKIENAGMKGYNHIMQDRLFEFD